MSIATTYPNTKLSNAEYSRSQCLSRKVNLLSYEHITKMEVGREYIGALNAHMHARLIIRNSSTLVALLK